MIRSFIVFLTFAVVVITHGSGCGRNKFQQEVDNETLAVNLARETERGDYELITAAELKKLIDKETSMVIVDAMPYEESYKKTHVPGARQFLFSKDEEMEEWDTKATGGKTQNDFTKLLGDDKDQLIVVYCGFVKCLRSHNGAMWAKRLGYTNVKRFPGGIYAWKGAGYPTKSK